MAGYTVNARNNCACAIVLDYDGNEEPLGVGEAKWSAAV